MVAQVDRCAALRVAQLTHRTAVRDVHAQEVLRDETFPAGEEKKY